MKHKTDVRDSWQTKLKTYDVRDVWQMISTKHKPYDVTDW